MAISIVSDIERLVESNRDDSLWMGLDVHKHSYHIALISGKDRPVTWSSPANPNQVVKILNESGVHLSGACFEAGPTGFTLARVLSAANIPVIVAAPNKVPRSVSPGSKTDRLDCIKLARFASKGLIRSIAVPSVEGEAERALLRRRHQIIDNVRKSKQRIKSLYLFHGFEEPQSMGHWSPNCIKKLLSTPFNSEILDVLKSHIRELDFLVTEQKIIENKLDELCKKKEHREVINALLSVPGVGFITATTFHFELFNPERFSRAEEVASYVGLSPTVRHSGQRTPRGFLMPVGQERLRSLLIESAWIWIRKDEEAGKFYRRLVSKSGISQKAITAVARKLAIILWRLSIEKRAYYVKDI